MRLIFSIFSASAFIWWLVLPGLHERAGQWGWDRRAGQRAGGCCKSTVNEFSVNLTTFETSYSAFALCLTELCPHRLKDLMVLHWSFGASWEATRESELSIVVVIVTSSYQRKVTTAKNDWTQCFPHRELVHLVKHICETLKAKRLDCILVIPPAVTRWIYIIYLL